MKMPDVWQLFLVSIAGAGLGLFFYGGLYFTVTRSLESGHPALWFLGSFLIRMSLLMTGLYWISDGHWQRIVACLLGIMVTGVIFQVRQPTPKPFEKARHAP